MNKVVILGTAHGVDVAGKTSPDKKFREYLYSREICKLIKLELDKKNIKCFMDITDPVEKSLIARVNKVEAIIKANGGSKNCIYISIHNNAAASDSKWHNASGFQVYCANICSLDSKKLAEIFHNTAQDLKLGGNRSYPKTKYYQANFYVLRKTSCPAVLTENLFQDNKDEVDFLLSQKGKDTIVKLHVDSISKFLNI